MGFINVQSGLTSYITTSKSDNSLLDVHSKDPALAAETKDRTLMVHHSFLTNLVPFAQSQMEDTKCGGGGERDMPEVVFLNLIGQVAQK